MATKLPALRIERVQLDSIHADPANARSHGQRNLEAIKSSLQRFGQQKPIVISPDGMVVAGNGTLEAARQLGWESISVVRTSLAGQERTAFAIADNRSAELAAWDPDALESALSTLDDDLREVVDINDEELRRIAEAPPPEDELGDGDNTGDVDHAGALAESFGVPPFSILDARQGWWQRRKAAWVSLGIQSELGRGSNALDFSTAARFGFERGDPPGLMMHGQDSLNRLLRGRNRAAAVPGGSVGKNSCWLGSDSRPASETGLSGTSIFDPCLTELCYRWFCPPRGLVLDPFAGGSVRGIVASRLGRKYLGIDLRQEQVRANERQAERICKGGIMPRWISGDSADIAQLAKGERADLIFTCPPYGDLERYSDNPRDLSAMDYPAFIEALGRILTASCKLLRENRFAAIVVGEIRGPDGAYRNFVGDTVELMRAAGLSYYNEAILVTVCGSLPLRVRSQFEGSRKLGRTHQSVLVFVKGDPRKATVACGECEFGSLETEPLPGEPDDGSEVPLCKENPNGQENTYSPGTFHSWRSAPGGRTEARCAE